MMPTAHEHQHDHRRDQQRALPDALHAGGERRLDALGERAPVLRLVRVRLHRADLVHRLVDVRAGIARRDPGSRARAGARGARTG